MESENAIEVSGLAKTYKEFLAVDHVDFDVRRGEIFGFLGPNGAGKTTTVRMLTTLLEPTEGTIRINGYDVSRQAYHTKRQFGVVPEESNVYTELSAQANLLFTGRLYRMPKGERERRTKELLKLFGLEEKRDVKAQFLSKGMRRRLAIAMAMMHRPAILFLDEATSGLDVQSARTIRDQMRQLSENGTTVFLTTHQIEEANQLCDRVAIIDHGRIAVIDTPEHLKAVFRSVQSVEVAFDRPDPGHRDALGMLSGVSTVVKHGDKYRLYSDDLSAVLPEVMDYAHAKKLRIITLNTIGPSLEDVFLQVTGRQIGTVRHDPADKSLGRASGKGRKGGNR
jgi:ABC-2 type transport system ATP-binding protein